MPEVQELKDGEESVVSKDLEQEKEQTSNIVKSPAKVTPPASLENDIDDEFDEVTSRLLIQFNYAIKNILQFL